jgi:hypothetical protein
MGIRPPRVHQRSLTVQLAGRFASGLVLSTDVGNKAAPLIGSPPEALARKLFEELIADSARRAN